jgi:hypothetical protein
LRGKKDPKVDIVFPFKKISKDDLDEDDAPSPIASDNEDDEIILIQ